MKSARANWHPWKQDPWTQRGALPETPLPKPETPMPKPETPMPTVTLIDALNENFHVANAAAVKAKKELADIIKTCAHQYEYTPARFIECLSEDGWGRSGNKWIRVRGRICQTCGLSEEQTQYDPEHDWADWVPVNAPFGATRLI